MVHLTIAYDRLRIEEKMLYEQAKSFGLATVMQDVKTTFFYLTNSSHYDTDVVLQRCISHVRGLHVAAIYESFNIPVVNRSDVTYVCGDKMLTTLILAKAGIPTPETSIAFSAEGALMQLERIGYPAVIKPVIGSWGRLVARVRDREEAKNLIESRMIDNDPYDQLFYVQKYVERPPRDIRAIVVGDSIVASIFRYQPEDDWRTNVARGGRAEAVQLAKEQQETILKAAEAVGGGVLGIDAMESKDGIVVHEVNPTVEFKGAASVSSTNIPREIVRYVMEKARR
ncbi:MAG: lysine biosynthesis protein LysX [Nitrososphaerota archaeon]